MLVLKEQLCPKIFHCRTEKKTKTKTLPILNSTLFNDTEEIGFLETLDRAMFILEFSVSIFCKVPNSTGCLRGERV